MIWKTPLAALALFALAGCQPAASETPAVEAAAAPAAASDQTHCVIEVEGKVWLDKPCDYSRDYVLVVNRSLESALRVQLPESLLVRADKVI